MAETCKPHIPCLKIQAPEWFEREDFRSWLVCKAATWYRVDGPVFPPDAFIYVDGIDEGSDFGDTGPDHLPDDIAVEIQNILRANHMTSECVVWIQSC